MIRRDKPDYCYLSDCPMASCKCGHNIKDHDEQTHKCTHVEVKEKKSGRGKAANVTSTRIQCSCTAFKSKGTGFVLGTGDPVTSRLAIWAEAPGTEEVAYSLGVFNQHRIEFDRAEIERRSRDYPDIPLATLRRGAPLVGKSGQFTDHQILGVYGIKHEEIFIDNTLRCLPPKGKNTHYPIGAERKDAERCCRHYDRWGSFGGDLAVVGIHPAALLREITPLPLNNRACIERARDFSLQGYKTIIALGGKAAKACLGYAENVTRWIGEYKWLKKSGS